MSVRRLGMLAIAGAVLGFVPPVRAEGATLEKPMAEALFIAAKELLAAGKVSEACPKFAESGRLDPQLGTLLFLATCHEKEGKTASAWAEFQAALTQLGRLQKPEPVREQYARERVADLEKRLSRIVLTSDSARTGIEVRIDGTLVGAESFRTPLPLDPGDHRIEASAAKRVPWARTVTLGQGPVDLSVDVPALEEVPAVAAIQAPDEAPVQAPVSTPTPHKRSSQRTFGYVAAAGSVVALGIGGYFGIRAIGKQHDADATECTPRYCTPNGLELYSEAKTSALASTIIVGVGLAAAGAAAYLLLTGHEPASPRSVRLVPAAGGASLLGVF